MSIINKTTNLKLTQFAGSLGAFANLYSRYNADMLILDNSYGEVFTKCEALEAEVGTYTDRIVALETGMESVNNTLTEYDDRLDSIESVIETVSTQYVEDLRARLDAVEVKVDSNANDISSLNDRVANLTSRITFAERDIVDTNSRIDGIDVRVTTLEGCCETVNQVLTEHNSRITGNANEIVGIKARLDVDENNIAGNATDIQTLATQNETQSAQIAELYERTEALEPHDIRVLQEKVETIETEIGDLTELETEHKDNLVEAINECLDTTQDEPLSEEQINDLLALLG